MRKLTPKRRSFRHLLGKDLANRLDTHPDSACGLWPDLTIGYVNPAWEQFARENGGDSIHARWSVGASFVDAIGAPLRQHFEQRLHDCFDIGSEWCSEYECSSPSVYRAFRMDVRTLHDGAGLLIVNTCVDQHPHDRSLVRMRPDPKLYLDHDGLMHQCVHCRRVRRVGPRETWDWVPEWVSHVPDNASGGLCPRCLSERYPDLNRHLA